MNQRQTSILSTVLLCALAVLGAYVTFTFIGVDGHIVVLLREDSWKNISKIANPFRRGLEGLAPMIGYLLERLKPLMAYGIASLLCYLAIIASVVLGKGRLYFDERLSALHILLLGVVSLWLMVTTLFYTTIPGLEQRLVVEPTAEVYKEASAEGLQVLQENFETLKAQGCLRLDEKRKAAGGTAAVYFYSGACMQKSFFTRVLAPLCMLLLFAGVFIILGEMMLAGLRLRPRSLLIEGVISFGLGAGGVTAYLWVMALFHVLGTVTAWLPFVLIPLAGIRFVLPALRRLFLERWSFRASFSSPVILLVWLLLSYIAFNYFTVIRPFPIGWDDLGKYINVPRQMSSLGMIIPGMGAIQWEYITSLGFLLFGYYSTFGATLAMQINWMAGIFALVAVMACARVFLGQRAGIIAALFYYTLPMVGHFSFADMKTENALFAYGVTGLTALLLAAFGSHPEDDEHTAETRGDARWLFVAGILFAAGFATKPTIILIFLMGLVMLTTQALGILPGIGAILFSFVILMEMGGLNPVAIVEKISGSSFPWVSNVLAVLLTLVGVVCIFMPFTKLFRSPPALWKALRPYLLSVGILLCGFLVFSLPWFGYNMILNGRFTPTAALSTKNTITPYTTLSPDGLPLDAPPGSRALPPELAVDPRHPQCIGTAQAEELDRYWGYGSGIMHYLGLPWRNVMNLDSQGYYLTMSPLLLLFPLILLFPAFWTSRRIRLLFMAMVAYVLQWILIANGIPWYGIGLFLGFSIFVEFMVMHAPDGRTRFVAGTLLTISLMTAFGFRFWQFDMQKNLYEYGWGKATADVIREMTIPDYNDVAETVLQLTKTNPDRPFLYRMGTFISYFIPRNVEVIAQNDNQLTTFNCLNQEGDHLLTLRRLQALGFHSIIFDTNTATIERDPNGTLHQKVNRFIDFLSDPAVGVLPVVNSPERGLIYVVLP